MGYAALAFREVADSPYQALGPDRSDGRIRSVDGADHARLVLVGPDGCAHPAEPVEPGAIQERHAAEPVDHDGPSGLAFVYPCGSADAEASDPDVIEELGDEIALLAAHLHAGTQRLLVLIAKFDRLRGWEPAGHRSCAHWLAFRTGIDLGTAREKVRAAHALETLPQTSAAMGRGELSFSQVRALSRVATAENEGELLELARGCTTAQLERVVRAWKKGSRGDEAEWERERHRSRTFSVFPDDDGMYVVRGRLMPEVGALLMRAIEAASDALFRETWVPGRAGDWEREAAQRRADAVGLLAERALAAGFGRTACECGRAGAHRTAALAEPTTDAAEAGATDGEGGCAAESDATDGEGGCACDCPEAPISGSHPQRYQVVLHVEPETLLAEGEPGRSELEDGVRVSAETSRRLCCDASVVRVTHAQDGRVLNVGRKTRTIPPALRRALEVRDRGCRFPGCGLRFAAAHHLIHWADGGETSLENCVLVCGWHHRLVHEGGWRVEWWGVGRPAFVDPRGQTHFDGRWKPPLLPGQPVAELLRENHLLGIEADARTAGAKWKREVDIPDELYRRVWEAL